MRRKWPPLRSDAVAFYVLSGILGFVLPFLLEIFVAPRLPLFIFVAIISTMPILKTILAVLTGVEAVNLKGIASVLLGFGAAIMITWDTAELSANRASWLWLLAAFAVPALYAVNTVFVASRWPKQVDAISVAHGQAFVVSISTGGLDLLYPLERVEIDEWEGDVRTKFQQLNIWNELPKDIRDDIPDGRRWIYVAIDCSTRCILALTVCSSPNSDAARRVLGQILKDKTNLARAAGAEGTWDFFGTPHLICTDTGSPLTSALHLDDINLAKPTILATSPRPAIAFEAP